MKAVPRKAALSAAALVLVSAGFALGQQTAPTDYKSVDEKVLASIDLAKTYTETFVAKAGAGN